MSLGSKLNDFKETPFPTMEEKAVTSIISLLAKTSDEEAIREQIEKLDQQQQDTLMKVIYKGLSVGKNSMALFKWHAQVAEVGGAGCIVRTLTSKVPEPEAEEDDE